MKPASEPRCGPSTIVRIESVDDPRVAVYRNLPDRTLRGENVFVAEGRLLTHRLLAGRYEVQSLLVTDEYLAEFAAAAPPRVPIYVADETVLLAVVGFNFHRGALGAGVRGRPWTFDEMLPDSAVPRPASLVICPEITKPENMGLIFRTVAGLGADGLLLGERCCDPFSRRCLRVSMGAVLNTPYVKTDDLARDVRVLQDRWRVELLAAVLDPAAESLGAVRWPLRTGLLLGNEYSGLDGSWLEVCPRRVTIPMQANTDSLNLGVAAGIFVYEMMKGRISKPDALAR